MIEQQFIQYIPDKKIECVRCGYCCKKATCDISLTHGAKQTNCSFLIGDAPGRYSCFLAEKEIYQDIKMHLGIGTGCCEPLFNDDRRIAIGNKRKQAEKDLVIARLQILPPNIRISIG